MLFRSAMLLCSLTLASIPAQADTWCTHAGSTVYYGDFDGDGGFDELCSDQGGNRWIRFDTGREWSFPGSRWCTHTGANIYISDYNGDGRSDLMCYDGSNRWYLFALSNGTFAF